MLSRAVLKASLSRSSSLLPLTRRHIPSCLPVMASFSTKVTPNPRILDDEKIANSAAIFTRLNDAFTIKPWKVSADQVMEDMRALMDLNIKVPHSFYEDSIRIFTTRNDTLRTQLLLLMSQKNLSLGNLEDPANYLRYTRSRPKDDTFEKLVSHTISSMIAKGNEDDAMRLWVRMDSAGYVTSRWLLQRIIHKIAASGKPIKNLRFIDKVYGMMVANLWNNSRTFHIHYLSSLRQYLQWSCHNHDDVVHVLNRIDKAWIDIEPRINNSNSNINSPSNIKLYSLKVQCLSVASDILLSLSSNQNHNHKQKLESLELSKKLSNEALDACKHLISSISVVSTNKDEDDNNGNGNSNLDTTAPLLNEMVHILGDVSSTTAKTGFRPSKDGSVFYEAYNSGLGSDDGDNIHISHNKLANFLQDFSIHDSTSEKSGSTRTSTSVGDNVNYTWQITNAGVRGAVLSQLISLSKKGKTEECLELLKSYLECLSLTAEADTDIDADADVSDIDIDKDNNYDGIQIEGKSPAEVLLLLTRKNNTKHNRKVVNANSMKNKNSAVAAKSSKEKETTISGYAGWDRTTYRSVLNTVLHSWGDVMWARYIITQIMENFTVTANSSASASASNTNTDNNSKDKEQRYKTTLAFTAQVEDIANEYNIRLGQAFLSQRITQASKVLEPYNWKAFERLAYDMIDSTEDSISRTSYVYGAFITSLCIQYNDPLVIDKSLDVVHEMIAADINITPDTYITLINGATKLLNDKKLAIVLRSIEDLMAGSSNALEQSPSVLLARLNAHTRLGKGYESLKLLSKLRQYESNKENSNVSAMTRYAYNRVINALYYSIPGDHEEWRIASDPVSTSAFFLNAMYRDGIPATENTVKNLLKLYGKKIMKDNKNKTSRDIMATLDHAEELIINTSYGGFCGHGKVPVGNTSLRELVKACCLGYQDQKALKILLDAKEKYGVNITAEPWEPLIYHLTKRGQMDAAKDSITLMTNAGIVPSTNILDAVATGYLNQGDGPEAVEKLEGFFNYSKIRPAASTLLKLLDSALSETTVYGVKGVDIYQAQRICSVIMSMYTNEERCSAKMNVRISTTNDEYRMIRAEESRQSYLKKHKTFKNKELENLEAIEAARKLEHNSDKANEENSNVNSIGNNKNDMSDKNDNHINIKKIKNKLKNYESPAFVYENVRPHNYTLDVGIGEGPILQAPLSTENLIKRFKDADVEMPKW